MTSFNSSSSSQEFSNLIFLQKDTFLEASNWSNMREWLDLATTPLESLNFGKISNQSKVANHLSSLSSTLSCFTLCFVHVYWWPFIGRSYRLLSLVVSRNLWMSHDGLSIKPIFSSFDRRSSKSQKIHQGTKVSFERDNANSMIFFVSSFWEFIESS